MQNANPGGQALCETCHAKAKYYDKSTGTLHRYCGKTCAANARQTSIAVGGVTQGGAGLCAVCQIKPQYFDGTKVHQYCGRTCAGKAKPANSQQPTVYTPPSHNTCQVPGCTNAPYTGSRYCGRTHKDLAATTCLWCRAVPKQKWSHFCGKSCTDAAQNTAVTLLTVPDDHETFQSVASQFKTSWRHHSRCPEVKHVYKIVALPTSVRDYEAYRQAVERKGNFVAQGRSAGNENRRWHGTIRECTLGEGGNTQFCSSADCALCSIIRTSFDLSLCKKATGFARFGRGIYTSSTSSKANAYSENRNRSASLKAVLLNKVVVGKGFKKTKGDQSLQAPPPGFDSVIAETGMDLKYDELVVYNNDAVRPSFLVMYEKI